MQDFRRHQDSHSSSEQGGSGWSAHELVARRLRDGTHEVLQLAGERSVDCLKGVTRVPTARSHRRRHHLVTGV